MVPSIRTADERTIDVMWQKTWESDTMDSLRKGIHAMMLKYIEEDLR